MPATIEYEPNGICVLRISGTLKHSEFSTTQVEIARKIDGGAKPRLLAILENFEGWERGADWNDLDFFFRTATKLPRSPSPPSRSGRCRLLLLPAREFAAQR